MRAVTATEILRQEHQSIRAMLNFTEKMTDKISRGEPAPPEVLAKVMDFIHLFVDQCHHSKEEEIFFPMLDKKGIPTSDGALGVMVMEHDRARGLIQEMSEAAEAYKAEGSGSGKRWTRAAWDYSDLMYDHFGKQDDVSCGVRGFLAALQNLTRRKEQYERIQHKQHPGDCLKR